MKWLLTLPLRWAFFLFQAVMLALGQIWTNKLRSFLTTIGIVIGVSSVVTVASVLAGLQAKVLGLLENIGTSNLLIFPQRTAADQARNTPGSRIRFKPGIFDDLLQNAPNVKMFTRQTNLTFDTRFERQTVEAVQVNGIESTWHEISHRFVTEGRPFNVVDTSNARAVCLVNATLQAKLGLNRDPTGQSIYIGNRRFVVLGVVEDDPNAGVFGGENGGAEAFIPFSTAFQINPNTFVFVTAAAVSTPQSEEAAAEITFYMRNKRKVPPGGEDSFVVRSVARLVEIFGTISRVTTVVATGVVGISLLVGGVGIMNIMLVSVSERTREIGLRKAVGANPLAILLQFLIEAITLCCFGGAIGLAIGQGITMVLRQFPALQLSDASVPLWAIYLSFFFSAGVGLTFGMFPAIKAARLDPIDALRHE
jgi:putative ABC transport system permease protein